MFIIALNNMDKISKIVGREKEIERIRRIDINSEYTKTKSYWRKYVKSHDGLDFKEPENSYEEKLQQIYYRSILLFPLLSNPETFVCCF